MARVSSQDLRDRIIDAAFSGKSARRSAAHFGIGLRRFCSLMPTEWSAARTPG